MVRVEVVSFPPRVLLKSDVLWISLCWTGVNCRGRSGHSGPEEDHSLESGSLVTWRDVADHIHRRWGRGRTPKIALSTKEEGTETAGGGHDVVLRPQSRNSLEANERSVISTRFPNCFTTGRK